MEIILRGIQFGIVLAFLVGPVFFTLLQTSVENGFKSGAMIAIGVSLSDALYVIVCYFGFLQFLNTSNYKTFMAYGGGLILIAFGIYHIFIKSKRSPNSPARATLSRSPHRYVLKGFIINGLSPMVLVFWLGAISIASVDFGYTKGNEFLVFFTAVLATVFTTDLIKAYLAHKLRDIVTPAFIRITNIMVGIILLFFGARLMLLANSFTFG